MKKNILVCNWKLNSSIDFSQKSIKAIDTVLSDVINDIEIHNLSQFSHNFHIILCPSFPYLLLVHEYIKLMLNKYSEILKCDIGSQNVMKIFPTTHSKYSSIFENGAFTGEISCGILQDIECKYSIIGHSERRSFCNEISQEIIEKAYALMNIGIIPIFCISFENQEDLKEELNKLISRLNDLNKSKKYEIMIAYEPVFAIGTNANLDLQYISEIIQYIAYVIQNSNISKDIEVNILYGGSVKSHNILEILNIPNLSGVLIGGASSNINDWQNILINYFNNHKIQL